MLEEAASGTGSCWPLRACSPRGSARADAPALRCLAGLGRWSGYTLVPRPMRWATAAHRWVGEAVACGATARGGVQVTHSCHTLGPSCGPTLPENIPVIRTLHP